MERWKGRVAVVTGASSGIGAGIARKLLLQGMTVVGVARRVDRIQALAKEPQGSPGNMHAVRCDVTKEEDILAAFKWIDDKFQRIDVLVNNAGVAGENTLTAAPTEEWRWQIDVNLLGLSICTREAVQRMRKYGIDDGHIIHIGSIYGQYFPTEPEFAMYSATKHAVRALTEGLRRDLLASKSHIRVTEISPGNVVSEILDNMKKHTKESRMLANPHLFPDDIGDAVIYALGAPPHVQIHEIIIKPVGEMV